MARLVSFGALQSDSEEDRTQPLFIAGALRSSSEEPGTADDDYDGPVVPSCHSVGANYASDVTVIYCILLGWLERLSHLMMPESL